MDIKKYIENKNLSLYKISKMAELPYTTVCDLVNGKTDIMKCSVETIYKLSKALGLKIEQVINKEEIAEFNENSVPYTKQDYYRSMLKNRKNVILSRESALEYMNLTDGNFSHIVYVYSTIDLPLPFIVKKVRNFNDIEYTKMDGILITSISQSINDMLEDKETDVQILDQAISHYYYENNESFNNLRINDNNLQRFNEEVPYAMQYYDN